MPDNDYCPQCGKHYLTHDDYACNFRYFIDDEHNFIGVWIPSPYPELEMTPQQEDLFEQHQRIKAQGYLESL